MSALFVLGLLLVNAVLAAPALGQAPPIAPTPMTPAPGAAAATGSGGWIVAAVLVIGLLVVIGTLVKIHDLRRKREMEAVHIQAQISDALLRDANLFGLPVAATAHAPFWSGTPVTVELGGVVPDSVVRDSVVRIARMEAERIRPDVEIVDRMAVRAAERAA